MYSSAPPPTDTGTHCALPSCGAADFLPLQCPYCSLRFCRAHSPPSSHACTVDPALTTLSLADAKRTASTPSGPELKELLPDPKRHKREEVALSPEETAKRERQQAALEKLRASLAKQKIATAGGAGPAKKPLSPALELMQLRKRAKPADPKHVKREGDVAVLDRVYLTVRYMDGETGEEKGKQEVWVAKTISAGKALDLFADLFKLNNQNNTTTDPLKLLSLASPSTDPPTRIILAEPLSAQVANAGSVLLLKGFPWPA
ncbi:hypothetical protein JCM8097_009364 [Rhodosporidiobolus ruineniae]